MVNETTTVRITNRTRDILKELSRIKKIPMNNIIYILAENELKATYKLDELLKK